jgi:hypothetical protein
MAGGEYAHALYSMMSYLDGVEYEIIEDGMFSEDRLLTKLTDTDIYRHFCKKAYGTEMPGPDDAPMFCRASTLSFHKKAISYYMPRKRVAWDEVRKEGNPTQSELVNSLIKQVEKHEVRGTGLPTAARRPIEWEEFIMLLVAARMVFARKEETMALVGAVMTLQWHFIGRIDDIMSLVTTTVEANFQHVGCLQLKMRKSKNIRSEREMPTQIFFGSMDPLVCPMLNLAVYVEMFFRGNRATPIFNKKRSTRNFSLSLVKLFESRFFKHVRPGKVGTHSLRKGPSTYASRFGLLKEWISLRGRWRTSKKQVDTYIDVNVPFPDAKVASVLCGPRGPCKYATREGIELTDDFLCSLLPVCERAFGRDIAVIFARALLWASFEPSIRVNDEVLRLIPQSLQRKILSACAQHIPLWGEGSNPIEKIGLLVGQRMDQLEIYPMTLVDVTGGSNPQASGNENQNIASQIFHLQQTMGDMRSEITSLFSDQRRHINTLSANVRRIALVPAVRGARGGTSGEQNNITSAPPDPRRVSLAKSPRDLWVLWKEWEEGLGGCKPAKHYTHVERGANKFTFSRRRVFWDAVEEMVKRGQTSDVAIDKIYLVYGWQMSVTGILNEMKSDRRRELTRF